MKKWRRNGNPLQYSCRENPMDGGVWWATVHGVAKSQTRLSNFTHSLICLLNKRKQQADTYKCWSFCLTPATSSPKLKIIIESQEFINWPHIFGLNILWFFKFIYFNWRLITLQYWFCHTSTFIKSHLYTLMVFFQSF